MCFQLILRKPASIHDKFCQFAITNNRGATTQFIRSGDIGRYHLHHGNGSYVEISVAKDGKTISRIEGDNGAIVEIWVIDNI